MLEILLNVCIYVVAAMALLLCIVAIFVLADVSFSRRKNDKRK